MLFTTCRYNNLLLGNVEELLQKPDPLFSTYQRVDCLYTLFKYQFTGNFDWREKSKVFDIVQRAVYFNQRNKEVDKT